MNWHRSLHQSERGPRDELALINPYSPALSAAWMLQRAMTAARAPGEAAPADLINRMLGGNFAAMEGLGDAVMKPFLQVCSVLWVALLCLALFCGLRCRQPSSSAPSRLPGLPTPRFSGQTLRPACPRPDTTPQDVLQFGPLARTMAAQMARDPGFVPQLVRHIGIAPLVEWVGHVGALGAYGALHAAAAPALRARLLPQLSPREGYRVRRTLEAWEYGSGADYKL